MNYATKVVIVDLKPESLVSSDYNKGKASQVQMDINKYKVDIDQGVFKKNSSERIRLKEAKLNYSVDPSKGKEEIVKGFLSSSIPNWNISLIINM